MSYRWPPGDTWSVHEHLLAGGSRVAPETCYIRAGLLEVAPAARTQSLGVARAGSESVVLVTRVPCRCYAERGGRPA
jgi:hypothetical protein